MDSNLKEWLEITSKMVASVEWYGWKLDSRFLSKKDGGRRRNSSFKTLKDGGSKGKVKTMYWKK